jgi:hypothetical protein
MHRRHTPRVTATLWLLLAGVATFAGAQDKPPAVDESLKFAIIGDSGTGSSSQYRVAEKLIASRSSFPYEFVLMMGDNLYGSEGPSAYEKKFERPYKPLLDSGVKFYASLGNHDDPNQRFYKSFNMNGERYYTFKPKDNIRIFALDSNYVDKMQLDWFEKQLAASGSDWKIVFFHHPIYSSGGAHGSDEELRAQLEPLFLKYGVDAVFQGHEHFYERIKPQKGIYYFISGAGGKLRSGDVKDNSPLTEKAFDKDMSFMILEIAGDEMHFQTITRTGETVDSGVIVNQRSKKAASASK